MITDKIVQLERYNVPKAQAILRFIAENDCANLPDGEKEIQGRELFVRIMSYVAKPAEENRFEAHRIYADLQYIVNGGELMQTAHMQDLSALTDYDALGDYEFFKTSALAANLIVKSGEFTVFYPQEAHRPSCAYEGYKGVVKKLVFKIKIK